MTQYEVVIEETLSHTVTVEATSEKEACETVRRMYYEEEVVLDSMDYCCTEIYVAWE